MPLTDNWLSDSLGVESRVDNLMQCGVTDTTVDGAERDAGARATSLAAKLTRLYETMRPANETLSDNVVSQGIFDKTGVQMSAPYLCLLRTGRRDNPTVNNLQAIAEYFGVPVSYLIGGKNERQIEAELDLLRSMRDAGIRDVATRLAGLTPDSIANIASLIDRLRQLEHLPPIRSASTS